MPFGYRHILMETKMANKLPNNYIEILTYLRNCHPAGMTTAQIMAQSKLKRYYEFHNSQQISSAIFYMRSKKLVMSIDAQGCKIHKITAHGIEQLDDEMGHQPSRQPVIIPTEPIDDIILDIHDGTTETQEVESPAPAMPDSAPKKAHDLLSEFDAHLKIVRSALIDELADIKDHRIENKQLKLAVLKKLEPMYNSEISGIIAAICGDLEQM